MLLTVVLLATTILQVCLADKTCLKEEGCDCGIAGKWQNQLRSNVTFTCKNGELGGKYNSAVGAAQDYYILSGRYTLSGPKNDTVELGWVVAWNNTHFGNSHSATSWSGIYYPEEEIIRTQWLLTSYQKRKDYWMTTMINHDEFRRVK